MLFSDPKVMRDPTSGVSRGFGFVSFETPEQVTKALALNCKVICTKPLYVALAQRKDERAATLRVQAPRPRISHHSARPGRSTQTRRRS